MKWYERIATAVLRQGAIPTHVAFIMDGNRRYAKEHGKTKVEGHDSGFQKLGDVRECGMEDSL